MTGSKLIDTLQSMSDQMFVYPIEGQIEDLVNTFNNRKWDDDEKEILRVTVPPSSAVTLDTWRLEQLAATEYGGNQESELLVAKTAVKKITKDVRHGQQVIQDILITGQKCREKREMLRKQLKDRAEQVRLEIETAKRSLNT